MLWGKLNEVEITRISSQVVQQDGVQAKDPSAAPSSAAVEKWGEDAGLAFLSRPNLFRH